MKHARRGRPAYSPARLLSVVINVELERHRLRVAGLRCGVAAACVSLAAREPFQGAVDQGGAKTFRRLSAAAIRGAFYRARRMLNVPPARS